MYNSLIKDRQIPAGTRETILVLHHPAPPDLSVMNFTTPLRATITEEAEGGRGFTVKNIWEIERRETEEKRKRRYLYIYIYK